VSLSVFDLFTIGIGPSSSHTVGPMRAARRFVVALRERSLLEQVSGVRVELFGSLGLTGLGHGSDKAVVLGLLGETPEGVEIEAVDDQLQRVRDTRRLALLGQRTIAFDLEKHLALHRRKNLPLHPNGLRFSALRGDTVLLERDYYSIGGGFVVDPTTASEDNLTRDHTTLPHPYTSGRELCQRAVARGVPLSQLILENELTWRSEAEVRTGLLEVWAAMRACVQRGCRTEGVLPGGLGVKRRAPALLRELSSRPEDSLRDPLTVLDYVNVYAMAVNEENAAGGRVVTAPTNGAAGIVPAVLHYWERFCAPRGADAVSDGVIRFLLTAGLVGILFKEHASISGAEVGCQGEVGVACSMAAAGLAELLGADVRQVENAGEIGMEHNLGLTCDPVKGLVQIPCIERNAMGAVKAINAARLALRTNENHITLDRVIATMRATGRDMSKKYKETAKGGLAATVNVTEC
jgi:L-serine dehydratase